MRGYPASHVTLLAQPVRSSALRYALSVCLALVLATAVGCQNESDTVIRIEGPPSPFPPTETELTREDELPGIHVTITGLGGATGPTGQFRSGDRFSFTFRVRKTAGGDWSLSELSGRALVSGPTVNYQRVLAETSDVAGTAVFLGDGEYRYTFAEPIPETYLPPYNDTASFGPLDGEWTGQTLISGTYTLGVYFVWDYTFEGASRRDAGSQTEDFLFGSATALRPRDVVGQENCNRCHDDLQVHGSQRRDIRVCVLCHTSGSEDKNVASVAGGTPGASVDMRVMIHKIHSGLHLPSVLGVTTEMDGSRNYAATPEPYVLVGFGDRDHDFSHVEFPMWPNLDFPMPQDSGYSALGSVEQGLEDTMRGGVTACDACHGDPDGAGPIEAPADGDLAISQPTRRACGSCHDDIVWEHSYSSNLPPLAAMPPQTDDSACLFCHDPTGGDLGTLEAHVHPLHDLNVNPGLEVRDVTVVEAGTNDGDDTLDPDETVEVTFDLVDGSGSPVTISTDVPNFFAVISGPTDHQNLVLYESFPTAALPGAPPYTTTLPERRAYERIGVSMSGTTGEAFSTARSPHWNVSGATTTVYARNDVPPPMTIPTLTADAPRFQNYVDVTDGSLFARDNVIVISDGTADEEYRVIQTVIGDRLWFSSPYTASYPAALTKDHTAGDEVWLVDLDEIPPTDYTLDAPNGDILEDVEFGDRVILASYTTDFVMPERYGPTLNESPNLDETWGGWVGKEIVSGTYTLTLWGYRDVSVTVDDTGVPETTDYRAASPGGTADFLVGDASTLEPYDLIASDASCVGCHQDLLFHGGSRRGYATCIACHGALGTEDRPPYVAPTAPDNDVTVSFRTMLHKVHMGEELTNASTYVVAGFGFGYPDNWSPYTYEHVAFPALPGGVAQCAKCHGEQNESWIEPTEIAHPTEQDVPFRAWRAVCGSCHDSSEAAMHIDGQTTTSGVESCAVCHGPGAVMDVRTSHVKF